MKLYYKARAYNIVETFNDDILYSNNLNVCENNYCKILLVFDTYDIVFITII